jgi:hypothetical protein
MRRVQLACRFIRTEEDDAAGDAWEVRLARRYYAKLFREYAIVDLSHYKARANMTCGLRVPNSRRIPSFPAPPIVQEPADLMCHMRY